MGEMGKIINSRVAPSGSLFCLWTLIYKSINNCIVKMEVGCPRHPGASTISSQLLDEDCCHGWQLLATQPWSPCSKRNRHPSHCWNSGKREGEGWQGCLDDVLPHYKNARKCLLYVCHTTIHQHVEFQDMCRHSLLPGKRKCSVLLTLLNCISLHKKGFWKSYLIW